MIQRVSPLLPNLESVTANYGVDARVTFGMVVSKLTSKPESVHKTKPLYAYFHKHESQYGELSQIKQLEARMAELFPEDPKLSHFASRYSGEGFEPTGVRLIVSPATQTRPKGVMQSIEQVAPTTQISPRPQYVPEPSRSPRPHFVQSAVATNSPKRPYPVEDLENELNRPRKLARGESPLKGAAGRRLDQQKRLQQGTPTWNAPPFVVPRDITFLLSIIPKAELYSATKFKPDALVRLLRETIVPDYSTWKQAKEESQAPQQRQYGTLSHYSANQTAVPPFHLPQQTQTRSGPVAQSDWHHGNPQHDYRRSAATSAFYGGNALSGTTSMPASLSLSFPPSPGFPMPPSYVADTSRSSYSYSDEESGHGNGKTAAPPRLRPSADWYGKKR